MEQLRSLKRQRKHLIKLFLKSIFKNRVYISQHDMIRGFKVTGDLGFLRKPFVSYEDRFLMKMNLSGKTVYDVGAHIGLMTLFFSRAVGETGYVVSFEPNPETFATLRKNVEMNKLANVRLANLGLAEKRETLTMVVGEAEGAMGTMDKELQEGLHKWGIKTKRLSVEVYPLDEYISLNSLPDPDFIKIDVEGYEYNVLLGMQETIRRCAPPILVEIHGEGEQKFEIFRNVVKLLSSHGYTIREINSGREIVEADIGPNLKGRIVICEVNSSDVKPA
jgi:FkbM family methyltransferase